MENHDPKGRSPGRWQRWNLSHGSLLALTFFLPAIETCGKVRVPSTELSTRWSTLSLARLELVASAFYLFVSLYLFGALMAGVAAARLWSLPRVTRLCERGVALLLALTASCTILVWFLGVFFKRLPIEAGLLGGFSTPQRSGDHNDYLGARVLLFYLLLPVVSIAYLARVSRRQPPWRAQSCAFAGALYTVAWTAGWVFTGEPCYGMVLSFVTCVGLLLGTVGETRALRQSSWRDALRRFFDLRER